MEERSRALAGSGRDARGGLSDEQRAVGSAVLLKRIRSFAADKGPEFIGDFFGPLAKWSLFIANALLESDDEVKQIISHVFGTSSTLQINPRKSPLQLLISFIHSSSEEVLQDAETMAAVHSRVRPACSLSALMLISVAMGGVGWRWVIAFHLGFYVYNWGQIGNQVQSKEDTLAFLAARTFLCICDAVATPPTLACRFLVHLLGSIMVLSLGVRRKLSPLWFFVCFLLMCFYTPLWLGLCVALTVYPVLVIVGEVSKPVIKDYAGASALFCGGLCFARILLYVVAGGTFCGALLLFLVPVVVVTTLEQKAAADMVAPLPLVCALLACFYIPFWVGVCFISTIVCSFALACNNVLAILWWSVSFATLHTLSYTVSRDFSVLSLCLWGSFFSYGCILT